MSHEIDHSNGRANIAFAGETPWHGLGAQIDPNASVDVWREAAGLDWEILEAPVMFAPEGADSPVMAENLNRKVLYRSDTKAPLHVVGGDYKTVQPSEILQFIGESVEAMGWKMETAGSLSEGRQIWALANTGAEGDVGHGDMMKGYLLAATSCDYSMASIFDYTTVRVVCANTLSYANEMRKDNPNRVKIRHATKVDIAAIKNKLGIASTSWERYMDNARRMARTRLPVSKAREILRSVYETDKNGTRVIEGEAVRLNDEEFVAKLKHPRNIMELYEGKAIGANMKSADGTAWGFVNAATEFFDHHANPKNQSNRLSSAWFGWSSKAKEDITNKVLELCD